jgi:amino acid adenylation domain-containing protein
VKSQGNPASGGTSAHSVGVAWVDGDVSGSVNERFANVAAAVPDRTAVADNSGRALTYRELAGASANVAAAVLSACSPGDKVALLSDLSVGSIAGLLGITAAGCGYVPVDWTEPAARAGKKLSDSGVSVIVLSPGLETLASAMAPQCHQVVVDVDDLPPVGSPHLPAVSPAAHFNLIYTSGSTGQPKGVIQNHRNVVFDTSASNSLFPISLDDRFGLVIPLTFGASVSDVAGALLNGARLDLFDLKSQGVDAMATWMSERRITVTHLVPTILRRWLSSVDRTGLYPDLRLIKAGGEPVFPSDLELFSSRFGPGCVLRNGLGTTETYLVAAAFFAPGDVESSVVPVGEPAPGRSVAVVGPDGDVVATGEVGEILVTSSYLSPGYWNNPEATDASFLAAAEGQRTYRTGDLGRIRPDGQLEHLGRVDDMVKVMGQQVHLTDIENVISEIEGIREACVVPKRDHKGDTSLVAYVVVGGDFGGSAAARSRLSGRIPAHMVPARFVVLDSLPTLPFGKVDRGALGTSDGWDPVNSEYREPRDEFESALASAAAAALSVERVGIDDDLFSLGLDSLSAVQLVARAREVVGEALTASAVLENPSISSLSEALRNAPNESFTLDLEALLAEVEEIGESGARGILDSSRK